MKREITKVKQYNLNKTNIFAQLHGLNLIATPKGDINLFLDGKKIEKIISFSITGDVKQGLRLNLETAI